MRRWRLLDTGHADAYVNMATDEALLLAHGICCDSMPVLRIYGWQPASFSIGYSQDPSIEFDLEKCQREGVPFVRRMTGGGIVFHARELTYSIVCSENIINEKCFAKETYRTLCSFILEAYNTIGLKAEFSSTAKLPPKSGWVCFQERERYDIMINGKKIGGNAQRRKKGLIFQHGSIPLFSDFSKSLEFFKKRPACIEDNTCSLSEAMKRDIDYDEFKDILIDSFKNVFCAELIQGTMNAKEKTLQNILLKSKYRTRQWNISRYADSAKAPVA
jgi:lipoyl(octanoyl) transferase